MSPPGKRMGGGDIVINQSFDFRNAEAGAESRLRLEAERIKRETIEATFAIMDAGGRGAKISGRRR